MYVCITKYDTTDGHTVILLYVCMYVCGLDNLLPLECVSVERIVMGGGRARAERGGLGRLQLAVALLLAPYIHIVSTCM